MNLYSNKNIKYFSNARLDLISLIPTNPKNKILEIGSGGGDTLVMIKEKGIASEVVGIELLQIPQSNQTNAYIDKIIFCDIETTQLDFPDEYFDVLLCGDVLEHLNDPWMVLNKLTRYLKKGGLLILSIPNIREFKTMYKILIQGDFRYEDSGILDKTHLKFFCRKNIIDLVSSVNLTVANVFTNLDFPLITTKKHIFNRITLKLFENFLALQYIVVAKEK